MNQDQVLGALRAILAAIGGYLISKGDLTSEQLTLVGGVLTAGVPLVWSLIAHTDTAKAAAAQAVPTVQVATTDPAIAKAVPGVTLASRAAVEGQAMTVPVPARPNA